MLGATKFDRREPGVGQIISVALSVINIHTCRYVRTHERKRKSRSDGEETRVRRRLRDPGRTRERLLQAAFREVRRSGFQSAGIDTILAATNVTKGALYHHFESKEALGYAIVDEVIAKMVRERWLLPLEQSKDRDPIDLLIGIVRAIPTRPRDIKGGCPLANLAQEMSQLD